MHDFRVANGATELLLIRHADAEHTAPTADLEVKQIDLPLTEKGHEQAKLLARRLAHRHLNALYASPLKRTTETATYIADLTHLPVTPDDRLREVEIGDVGSVSLHDLATIALAQGGWSHLPNTEPSAKIRERMCAAVEEAVEKHPGERVALVSHAGAINAYLSHLLGLHGDFFFPAGNTSISVVRARDTKRLIVTLNDTAHLENLR